MTIKETDIATLIEGCKGQHASAQKELLRRYAPSLMSVARRYSRNPAEAEDILQDSFIQVFGKIETYDAAKGSIATWMRKIVVNTALSHCRKFSFQYEKAVEILPDSSDYSPDVFSKLGFDELLQLVNSLPDGAREVFNMAVFDEFSHDEIASALQIPAGTSRSLLSRARKILQDKILKLQSNELARI